MKNGVGKVIFEQMTTANSLIKIMEKLTDIVSDLKDSPMAQGMVLSAVTILAEVTNGLHESLEVLKGELEK